MKKVCRLLISLICFLTIFTCGCSNTTSGPDFVLYYVGTDSIAIVPVDYKRPASSDVNDQINELIEALTDSVSGARSCVPPMGGVQLNSMSYEGNALTLDFGQDYLKLGQYEEISIRAAIVKTLVQLDDVDTVFFTVNGEQLADANNSPVGGMKAESFADISADAFSSTKAAKLKLYFSDESGDYLVVEERSLYYKNALSPERVVMEQLLAGPSEGSHKAIASAGTKLLDISVKEGTCYVNLDSTFSKGATAISPEVTVYAIVNSLAELNNISKVQISVEADSNVKYMETISLNQAFSRNLDLVKKE
ncbi:MAG: GerMN domain-containing protein [Lachnospiraceae bacterium]|nr:GerMN domain-containing protein [Lachnospiraceae bacterium]